MELEKIQVGAATPEEALDTFVNTANNYFVERGGDWSLITMQLIPGIAPAAPGSMLIAGQPQQKVFYVAIGIFQRQPGLAESIDKAINEGISMALKRGSDELDESEYCVCGRPFRLKPTDTHCENCGGKIKNPNKEKS